MEKTLILNWKHHWVEEWKLYLPLLRDFPWIQISPPIPILGLLAMHGNPRQLIAPYMSCDPLGPFTGACGPEYLKNLQVSTVILGHSEQRVYTSSEQMAHKIRYAQDCGLKIILCVGESQMDRYKEELFAQIQSILPMSNTNLAIAYEPKWAIGTGKPCSPEHCLQVLKFLKSQTSTDPKIDFYYGGSIDCENAKSFLRIKELRGLLVGSLSLKWQSVKQLIETIERFKKEKLVKKALRIWKCSANCVMK